jgi:polar amino acid transport system substrate-binding protein
MKKEIIVGISSFSPLVIIGSNNKYDGFEIKLWEKIASKIGLKYKYREMPFKDLLSEVKKGAIDIAISGITRTKEREKDVSFSYFTMRSGLAILLSKKSKLSLIKTVKDFFSRNLKGVSKALVWFFIVVILMAHVVWFFEKGEGNVCSSYSEGIFDSVWWVLAIASTVGGFAPVTIPGKLVGFFMTVFGVLLVGVFIAKITSLFAISTVKYKINSSGDLKEKRVATKEKTVSVDELERLGSKVYTEKSIEDAYEELRNERVDAVVFDEPVLRHYVKNQNEENDFLIVPEIFNRQTYGFAFQHESELRERVNRELLGMFESGEYDLLYKKWFGA